MHWFTSVVLAYAEKHGNKYGWKSMLARKLDESPSTVKNWADGKLPTVDKMMSVIVKLGGDPMRMLPDWTPESRDTSLPCAKIKA